MRFEDRRAAGRALAEALRRRAGKPGTIVLGLARGGVPVAAEAAAALGVPLDVFIVRKLGAPGQPELAVGAIASGGAAVVNEETAAALGVGAAELDALARREGRELRRREKAYRGSRPPLDLAGRTVILVDDGLATGASMLAAVRAAKALGAAEVVAAVPVGDAGARARIAAEADEAVCLYEPPSLGAVSEWYRDFAQTTDEEVRRLLAPEPPPRR